MPNEIRVAIADDHSIIRREVVDLVLEENNIKVVAQLSNGPEAISHAGFAPHRGGAHL